LPVEYIHDSDLGRGEYLILTLQYGKFEGDPLSVRRDPDPEKAHLDVYIHPIVEHFRNGELIGACHIPENLENDWDEDHKLDAVLSLGLPGVSGTLQEQKSFYREKLQQFLTPILARVLARL
jgi:hypothetical protein